MQQRRLLVTVGVVYQKTKKWGDQIEMRNWWEIQRIIVSKQSKDKEIPMMNYIIWKVRNKVRWKQIFIDWLRWKSEDKRVLTNNKDEKRN